MLRRINTVESSFIDFETELFISESYQIIVVIIISSSSINIIIIIIFNEESCASWRL